MTRRRLLFLALYAFAVAAGWAFGQSLSQWATVDTGGWPDARSMVLVAVGIYSIACAVPFVPGAEIGLALIAALGVRVALLVYFGMVGALVASYTIGRFVPGRICAALFGYLGLHRARDMVLRIAGHAPEDRVAAIVAVSPNRFVPFLLRHRYIALAIALNLPGNMLVGGGGGLGLVAGMSGLFRFVPFIVTVACAAAPLPLIVLVTGYLP